MKDSVDKFLGDESFCLLPLIMIQGSPHSLDKDSTKSGSLTYKDKTFWFENNQLHVESKGTHYIKDIQEILAFPIDFPAKNFFDSL